MSTFTKLILIILCTITELRAQDSEIDRLMQSELKMTFPSIYFKHNSTDYATMPYKIDSCFNHIAFNYNRDINSLIIWRDTNETEALTNRRINKLHKEFRKYIKVGSVEIHSMGKEQKISRRTIKTTIDKVKINYLLTLNSVFDISKTHIPSIKVERKKEKKGIPHLVWTGWRTGFHWSTVGKTRKKSKNNSTV